ncbi:MAG: DUF402 domain-containing protein [Acidobacteria bacterium]|nr:DUF402 domain-containing protein [Acidobacteriota bacterium]
MKQAETLTVNSRKYNGEIRRTWQAGLMQQRGPLIVLAGRFQHEVDHDELGHIAKDTASFEYFWTDRWYNVFAMYEPGGALRNYYCNIALPASLNGLVLDFVDLDIDVAIWPDGTSDVLDLDDFEENKSRLGYPQDVVTGAQKSLRSLLDLIDRREFPFEKLIDQRG